MQLAERCVQSNLAWKTDLYAAYHFENANSAKRTVFHYQLPLPPEEEKHFLARTGILPKDRMDFYQQLAMCVQRNLDISSYLKQAGVTSTLAFSNAEQETDENGVAHIYLESQNVLPVLSHFLYGSSANAITIMDLVYRVAIIFRDIAKHGVTYRGFDLNEVFINDEGKFLLGGFYYADCTEVERYTDYLPNRSMNLPDALLRGETGTQMIDIQSLCMSAWNLFSGIPHDAKMMPGRLVFPEYATEEIAQLLVSGMSAATVKDCNQFRRNWLNLRKQLGETDFSQAVVPLRKQLLKDFQYV